MAGDLHTHTNFSDGSTDIEALLALAQRANITHLAVSDHDTSLCLEYAYHNPVANSVTLIPAVELSCVDNKRQRRVHLLCYYPDITDELNNFFALMKGRRNAAIGKSINQLVKLYPLFSQEEAEKLARKSGIIYKTHLMRVLYECGYTDGIFKELFNELFGANKGKVLHEPQYEGVYDVLKLINNARGVAVLAHPSVYNSLELADELAAEGLIDGIEIYHPRNKQNDIEKLKQTANKYNLIITGGSDFHGMHMSRPAPLGSYTTELSEVEKIINLAKNMKNQ